MVSSEEKDYIVLFGPPMETVKYYHSGNEEIYIRRRKPHDQI